MWQRERYVRHASASLLPLLRALLFAFVGALSRAVLLALLPGMFPCVLPATLAAQQSQATGSLQGTVRAAPGDAPLAYAVVSLPGLSVERFTDGSGRFTLISLPVGRYDVAVRRIGYAPFRGSVQLDSARVTQLDVRLTQVPVQLSAMTVRALACANPGPPDAARQPDVVQLINLVRENADRYRLLASQYPFRYLQVRATGELRDDAFVVQRVDSALVQSVAKVEYRPGRVVQRVPAPRGRRATEYSMQLPTILDLADDTFARNHCFAYGGTLTQDGETWLRLDARAADKLRSPDVHGAFYLDSATSQLRRMELELSRPDRLPGDLRGVEAVQATTAFTEIAAGLSVIRSVCAINRVRMPRSTARRFLAAELQQLLAYEFTNPPPDIAPGGVVAAPGWRPGLRLSRDAVWCER